MTARVATFIGSTIAIGSGFLSAVAIWLILTRPLMLASTTDGHDLAAFFRAFAGAAYSVVVQLLGYL